MLTISFENLQQPTEKDVIKMSSQTTDDGSDPVVPHYNNPEHHILFESSNTYESKNMELFTSPFLLFTNNNTHESKCKQISIHNIS
jgi:hypothetical protein